MPRKNFEQTYNTLKQFLCGYTFRPKKQITRNATVIKFFVFTFIYEILILHGERRNLRLRHSVYHLLGMRISCALVITFVIAGIQGYCGINVFTFQALKEIKKTVQCLNDQLELLSSMQININITCAQLHMLHGYAITLHYIKLCVIKQQQRNTSACFNTAEDIQQIRITFTKKLKAYIQSLQNLPGMKFTCCFVQMRN